MRRFRTNKSVMQKTDKNREQFTFRLAALHSCRRTGIALFVADSRLRIETDSRLGIKMGSGVLIVNVTDQIDNHQGRNKQGDKADFCGHVGANETHR